MKEFIFGGFEIFDVEDEENPLFSFFCNGRGSDPNNKLLLAYDEYYKKLPKEESEKQEIPYKNLSNIIIELLGGKFIREKILTVKFFEPPRKANREAPETWDINVENSMKIVLPGENDKEITSFIKLNKLSISERGTYTISTKLIDEPHFSLGLSNDISQNYITPLGRNKNQRTLSLQNNTGTTKLKITDKNNNNILEFRFDVRPEKLSYEETKILFEEVYKKHVELLFQNRSPVSVQLAKGNEFDKTEVQRLMILDEIINNKNEKMNLQRVIQLIANDPHKKLIIRKEVVPVHEADYPDFSMLDEIIRHSFKDKESKKVKFTHLVNQRAEIVYDTPPNKFVKYVVQYFNNELLRLEKTFKRRETANEGNSDEFYSSIDNRHFIKLSNELRKKTFPILNSPFFKEISSTKSVDVSQNQVLLKEPRYRKITENYLKYISRIELLENFKEYFDNPLKWLPELYEYWCFFKINELVSKKVGKANIQIEVDAKNELKENKIIVTYKDKNNIKLYYNFSANVGREPYESYSVNLRPDIALKVGDDVYIFDAKYRVENKFIEALKKKDDKKENEQNDYDSYDSIVRQEKRGNFLMSDIYKMHTYRDALSSNGSKVKWVVALYPGDRGKLWHQDEGKEFSVGGVGAIPLKPSEKPDDSKLSCFLGCILEDKSNCNELNE